MPVNVEQTAAFAALAKSFTSSYEARDQLATALREHLGVTPRDSFWMSDDGIDDVLGPVVIYQFNRDVYDGNGGNGGVSVAKASPGTADSFFRATYSRTADGFVFSEPVAVRRKTDYVRDSADDEGAEPGSDEAELPAWLAEALARAAGLVKGAGHKYVRRVPKSGGGFRYFYKVSGGKGLGHGDEMQVGAKFRVTNGGKDGHFEIVGKNENGTLRIKHDESGHESVVSPLALRSMLRAEHAQSLTAHREKLAADIKAADDPKAKARLLAEAGKYEHTRDLAEPMKTDRATAKDVNVSHNLSPAESKMLDYRLRAYDFGNRADNLGDELRGGVTGDDAKRWVSRLTGQIKEDPFAVRLDVPEAPKGITKTKAKEIVAKVEALKSGIADELHAAGHHEAHDSYDTHKIHQKAYAQVAGNISKELGAGIGESMLHDTAGVGLKAVSDAALHGKGNLSHIASMYAEDGRKSHARAPSSDYYKAPAYSGGPSRADSSSPVGMLAEAGYSEARAKAAKNSADVAAALEAKGFPAGAAHHRAVADREAADAEFFRTAAKAKTDKANAERDAALKAEKDKRDADAAAESAREEAHLRAVAKPGEDVIHITTSTGKRPVLGKVHHGEYAVHRPIGAGGGFSVTHMKTGQKVATVTSHKAGTDLVTKLRESVPSLGGKTPAELTRDEARTAQDIIRNHAGVKKSMSSITDPERDLAKSLADSHRAAAERQPDAGARAAHEAAAHACDAAAEADGTTDYRKALGAAGRIGGLVKAWSNIPDAQRPPFDDFRKSMTQAPSGARLGAIGFRPSNGSGDALGGLSKSIAAARPTVEQPTPVAPEASTYSVQRGAVNRMRKSMGAFYDQLSAGATPARLDIRFPPEAKV